MHRIVLLYTCTVIIVIFSVHYYYTLGVGDVVGNRNMGKSAKLLGKCHSFTVPAECSPCPLFQHFSGNLSISDDVTESCKRQQIHFVL